MRNLTVLIFILFSPFALAAGSHDGGHQSTETMGHDEQMGHHGEKEKSQDDQHGHMDSETGGHAHRKWVKAPAEYQELMQGFDWSQPKNIRMGKRLYNKNCVSCHGKLGQGGGPVAKSLQHVPANLTNHFHKPGAKGDGYLLWRVSEGGKAEPFNSQNSAMPAFNSTLSLAERKAVLSYVHEAFHQSNNDQKASDKQAMDNSLENGNKEHDQSVTATEHGHNPMENEDQSL